ncbi:MAG: ThiF family adenylyltransferase [Ferruginibacter sp.]
MENYIRIKSSWQIFAEKNTLIFYNSYGKEISVLLNSVMKELLQLLAKPVTEEGLINQLAEILAADPKDANALIGEMKALHILENYLPAQIENTSYQKFQTQLSFFDLLDPLSSLQSKIELQEKLSAVKIMVIGCGGIGCSLLQSIAAAGIGHITIVDGDKVEPGNLGKQLLFTQQDIGAYKAEAAAAQLLRIAPDAVIVPITTFINSAAHLEEILTAISMPDFMFLSADEPGLPFWVDAVCQKLSLPFMKVSYLGTVGFIGPLIVPNGKRFAEVIYTPTVEQLQNEFTNLHNKGHKHASTVFTNSIIANLAITELVKFILHIGEVKTTGRRLYFSFETMEAFFDDE